MKIFNDISDIELYPYLLVARNKLNSYSAEKEKKGTLLKINFRIQEQTSVGYADCFSWPSLGDLPLKSQIELLSKKKITHITRSSLNFAYSDAIARMNDLSLLNQAEIPLSHYLITDIDELNSEKLIEIADQKFKIIKIKVGSNFIHEVSKIKSLAPHLKKLNLQLRLDFNSLLSVGQFEEFLNELDSDIKIIDFIEDPIPYEPSLWKKLQLKWKIKLALDRIDSNQLSLVEPESISVLVIKPALQDWKTMINHAIRIGVPVVVTSYMAHPYEQMTSAWVASQILKSKEVELQTCGLLSHTVYSSSFNLIQHSGPSLIPADGVGFGMDDFLRSRDWIRINDFLNDHIT